MSIKLIAIDMDGTLLNSNGMISNRNREALQKAIDSGILIVPATGRVLETLPEPLKQMKAIKYVITSNGAAVYDKMREETIYTNLMPKEKVVALFEILNRYDIIVEIYIEGKGYFEERFLTRLEEYHVPKSFQKLYETIKNPVPDIFEFIKNNQKDIEKLNMPWLKAEKREHLLQDLKTFPGICVTSSLKTNVEINNSGVNKGEAVKGLCQKLHLNLEEVMAIGDSYNDREMLEAVGTAVVMENGEYEIKKLGKFITRSNDDDGVAYAIEKFCFR